jgi:hypothetical protein
MVHGMHMQPTRFIEGWICLRGASSPYSNIPRISVAGIGEDFSFVGTFFFLFFL